jgi:hypothetical protein
MQSLEDERNALSRRLSSPAMITQPEEQARLTARVNALDTQIAQERERMRGNVADTTVTNRTTAPSAPASPPIDPNDPNAAAWDLPDAGAPKVVRAIVTLKDGTRHIAEGTEEDLNREYPRLGARGLMPVKLLGPVEQAPKKVRLLGPVKDPIFAGLPGPGRSAQRRADPGRGGYPAPCACRTNTHADRTPA